MLLLTTELHPRLLHLRVVGHCALSGALGLVVPVTDAAKILHAVIVAAPNVVYIDGWLPAGTPTREWNLTPGLIAAVDPPANALPICGKPGLPV